MQTQKYIKLLETHNHTQALLIKELTDQILLDDKAAANAERLINELEEVRALKDLYKADIDRLRSIIDKETV